MAAEVVQGDVERSRLCELVSSRGQLLGQLARLESEKVITQSCLADLQIRVREKQAKASAAEAEANAADAELHNLSSQKKQALSITSQLNRTQRERQLADEKIAELREQLHSSKAEAEAAREAEKDQLASLSLNQNKHDAETAMAQDAEAALRSEHAERKRRLLEEHARHVQAAVESRKEAEAADTARRQAEQAISERCGQAELASQSEAWAQERDEATKKIAVRRRWLSTKCSQLLKDGWTADDFPGLMPPSKDGRMGAKLEEGGVAPAAGSASAALSPAPPAVKRMFEAEGPTEQRGVRSMADGQVVVQQTEATSCELEASSARSEQHRTLQEDVHVEPSDTAAADVVPVDKEVFEMAMPVPCATASPETVDTSAEQVISAGKTDAQQTAAARSPEIPGVVEATTGGWPSQLEPQQEPSPFEQSLHQLEQQQTHADTASIRRWQPQHLRDLQRGGRWFRWQKRRYTQMAKSGKVALGKRKRSPSPQEDLSIENEGQPQGGSASSG